ncbi:MAG: oxaloacetate decarboxylase [Rhodospirillaceae bacterium]|jgi:2-methylisocitrate lyase-like PEP mutase family enzyme|nr:oxaloacetate decarboxylase [Rhodospirillales bacterium]MBT3904053.1 oxaloacetate decarboxylase [Rhodospirillaceae bacterium]MBT4701049.1 oxaloacetate decarboxylase [Rhodospirillaceae bacterium]MBT5036667.1 oxaloacetate decarboxylase [Rhodospirillaceae bacterium]MBT6218317.1 oxaloacetate decarboxylase [Rhodospirillaceae bacterium]
MSVSLNKKFKDRVAKRDGLVVPGVANALAARIVEDIGFEAAYVTGAGVTNTYLGKPDIALISLTQLADHIFAMRDVVEIPLIVDADTGFGNAVSTVHTVRVLERAGANCIQLEDQVFPKRCGHFAGKDVVPTEELVQKIHAAVDTRLDDDLTIIARTDARATKGLDDAIDRANAFLEAGADIAFVEAPRSVEEMREIPKRVDAPHLVNNVAGGLTPLLSAEDLREMGFAIILYANAALQASVFGMQQVLGHIHETGSIEGVMDRVTGFEERQRLVSKPEYDAMETKYSTEGVDS